MKSSFNDINVKTIGDRIRYAREKAGLTKADMARALKTSSGHIGDKESNRTKPSYPLLMAIELLSGVSAEWMLTGRGGVASDRDLTRIQSAIAFNEVSEEHHPPARDWIALPDHDPAPLEEEERSLLQETALILRCPRGTPNPPSEGLKPLIKTLAGTTAQLIESERHKKKSRLG